MIPIPKIEDFKLDFKLYPIKGIGGIVDASYCVREQDVQDRFEAAKEQWAKEGEQQIKTLEKYSKAQEKENQRNQKRIKELKEASKEALKELNLTYNSRMSKAVNLLEQVLKTK